LRILVITNAYPTDKNISAAPFVKNQVDSIRKINTTIQLDVCFNPIFKLIKNPVYKKSLFWKILKYLLFNLVFLRYFFKKYDLVHAHQCFYPGLLGYLYKLLHKVPLVITSHGGDIDGMANISKIVYFLEKRIFHKCDKIITVSSYYKEKLSRQFYVDQSAIDVISCGTNLKTFRTYKNKRDQKIEMLLDVNKFHLLFVGTLIERKDPMIFLKALKEINGPKVCGVIIGEGPLLQKLKQYSFKHKLNILFKEFMPQEALVKWMQSVDLFVFPSKREPFGLVGVEALASGTPVIASKVGGKIDYIINNYNGLFFKAGCLSDLICKLKLLFKDKDLYNQLCKNSVRSVKSFSAENQAKKIIKIYSHLSLK